MSQYGHYIITCGRYIKRGKMSGKCLFLPLKGSKSHAKYYFQTPGGPIYLPIKYRNFAQSPFKAILAWRQVINSGIFPGPPCIGHSETIPITPRLPVFPPPCPFIYWRASSASPWPCTPCFCSTSRPTTFCAPSTRSSSSSPSRQAYLQTTIHTL